MDSMLMTLQAGPVEDKLYSLQKMLELSTVPDEELSMFLSGALDQYVSALDKQLDPFQKGQLIALTMDLLNGNEATVQVRQHALELLRNFSRSKENRARLYQTAGLLDMLLEVSKSEQHMCVKMFALGTLNNMAITDDMAHEMLQTRPQLADILVSCASDEASNEEVKEKALKTLMNLAACKMNQPVLINMANVVDGLISHTSSGMSVKIRERACKALSNLATLQANRVVLFDKPGLIDVLMESARSTSSVILQQIALQMMFLLADNPANKVRMFQRPQLVDVLIDCVKNGETSTAGVKEWAIVTLIVLTSVENHKVLLFQRPGVVETLLECARTQDRDMAKLKEWALGAFMVLASAQANKSALFDRKDVLASIVDCVLSPEDTPVMKEHALGALFNLSMESSISKALYADRVLLIGLIEIVTKDENQTNNKVTERTKEVLQKLGCSVERAHFFKLMFNLCSLYDVPRLNRGSQLRMLDRDMLRLVGATLGPLPNA